MLIIDFVVQVNGMLATNQVDILLSSVGTVRRKDELSTSVLNQRIRRR